MSFEHALVAYEADPAIEDDLRNEFPSFDFVNTPEGTAKTETDVHNDVLRDREAERIKRNFEDLGAWEVTVVVGAPADQ